VHRRRELPTALTELALERAGVVTRQQATTSGLGRHVIERLVGQRSAESWMVLAPGIYFTRSGPVPWLALAWAGVLVGGPGSVLTKLSAATMHGLTDLPARTRLEDTVLDLCACGGPADVVEWITKAVQRRLTTPARLHEALLGRRRQRHRFLIEQVLGDADAGVHSGWSTGSRGM